MAHVLDDFPIKPSIYEGFSMAMLKEKKQMAIDTWWPAHEGKPVPPISSILANHFVSMVAMARHKFHRSDSSGF